MAGINAKMAEVKKLYITHHSPEETDEKSEKKLAEVKDIFQDSELAYEEMEINI